MDKLLLTPTEAATALGIGRSKVYELMQTGQLQSVHIGRLPARSSRCAHCLPQAAAHSQLMLSTDATHQRTGASCRG